MSIFPMANPLLATGRLPGQRRVRPSLPYVSTILCTFRALVDQWCRQGALNWATGETVAVKEIQLSNIPKAELGEIMVRPRYDDIFLR